jgi:FtsH-binding integral membrane protein
MKKVIIAPAILFSTLAAFAQDNREPIVDRSLVEDVINISVIVLVIYLISSFILQLIRQNFDYRLKSKILEKGTAETLVSQLVEPDKKDQGQTLLQWIFVLTGIAFGFMIIHFSRPFGLHSLAIMAFCVAASLGGYYYFSRRNVSK